MRTLFTVLTFTVTLFFAATAVFPAGQQEDPIDEAEQLIDERRYNEAIEILQEVGRNNPERFNDAERLLARIREARARYNELWQELIDTLQNEPDNVSRANAIIEEMEGIDDAPTEQALEEFEQWRSTVRLRFNLNRFEQISNAARGHIADGNYEAAITEYAGGLGLFREDFEMIDYEGQLQQDAIAAERMLSDLTEAASGRFEEVRTEVSRISELLSERNVSEEDLEPLISAFENAADTEFRAAGIGGLARALNAQARRQREMNDPDPYLTFLRWFAYGRTAEAGREGIFAAARLFVEEELERLIDAGEAAAESKLDLAGLTIEDNNLELAATHYRQAGTVLSALEGILVINDRREEIKQRLAPGVDRAEILDRQTQRRGYDLAGSVSIETAHLAEIRAELPRLAEPQDSLAELEELWRAVATVYRDSLDHVSTVDDTMALSTEVAETPQSYIEDMGPVGREMHEQIIEREIDAISMYLEQVNERSERQISTFRSELNAAELIGFEGVPYDTPEQIPDIPEEPEDQEALTYRYPGIARQRLQGTREAVADLVDRLDDTRTAIDDPNPPVNSDEQVSGLRLRLDEAFAQAQALLGNARVAIADLEERIIESEELRQTVRALLADAQDLVDDNPDAADERFSEAEETLVDALELQQDPEFRDETDAQLADLGTRIREAQFQLAVVEVREMVNEGRSLYRQDQFGEAESVLLRAEERWQQVSDTENSEVQYWLRLTQSALNLRDERQLTDTDPLYRVLGSYLSLASEAFNRGRAALEQGNEQEAERHFARAQDNIQSVTVARPFNRDARVLSLRITELTDPDEFEEIFQQRLNQAIEAADTDPNSAINDLYDLREVDPDWPGLNDAIRRVEIAAGIREPPRDDTTTDESNALLAQARQEFEAGNAEVAQEQLQDAVRINPDNDAARRLLDQVRLEVGTSSGPVLTSSELQQFRRAENYFIDGQIGRALLIVERLWQDEDNRSHDPLASLRSRMVNR